MRNREEFNTHLLCTVYLLLSLDLMKDSSKDLELIVLELSLKFSLPWDFWGTIFGRADPICFSFSTFFLTYLLSL